MKKLLGLPCIFHIALVLIATLPASGFAQNTSTPDSARTVPASSVMPLPVPIVIPGPPPVKAPTGHKTALIIIDMQAVFVTRGGNDKIPENQKKVSEIIAKQAAAIKAAEKAGIPILFIEYQDQGKTNQTLKDATKDYKKTATFLKDTDGIFEDYNHHRKEITDYLEKEGIKNLIITGANGGACVLQSITSALHNEYSVIAYTPAIADFNYKDFIYPYTHKYGDVKALCTSCTFKEVEKLEGVLPNGTPVKVIKIVKKSHGAVHKRVPATEDPSDREGCLRPNEVIKMKRFTKETLHILEDPQ